MSMSVELHGLTVRYGATTALDDVDLTIPAGTVCGLLGRNGSGKTTMLSVLAAFRRPTAGTVLVDGEDPWENPRVLRDVCLVRESGDVLSDLPMRENLAFAAGARPRFDADLAGALMDRFELDPAQRPDHLSRGKRSAFGVVVGIASRAALTLLDEVHLGMDAPSRYAFYDALLADYVEHPRTIILSSHLIDEVQRLLESVVILHRGGVLLTEDAETLRGRGVSVTGPAEAVEEFTTGYDVLSRQQLGRTVQAMIHGEVPPDAASRAAEAGLELGPVDLQDLFVHLTAEGSR